MNCLDSWPDKRLIRLLSPSALTPFIKVQALQTLVIYLSATTFKTNLAMLSMSLFISHSQKRRTTHPKLASN